jgi:riboflavin kinase/FMN adenylyltransferase
MDINGKEINDKDVFPYPVLTLGNFDGVHLGHQEIFRMLMKRAERKNGTPVVFTFIPHPLKIIAPEKAPKLITNYKDKIELIKGCGIDAVICANFTKEFSQIPADDFVRNILCGKIRTKEIFIGANYLFGKDRKGSPELLKKLGKECGFTVTVLNDIKCGDVTVSSSMIREVISEGRIQEASKYLGRNYFVEGVVIEGANRGKRLINIPTANLSTINELLPNDGVYAVQVDINGKIYGGAANIGYNPTFDDHRFSFEIHIFNFEGNLLGKTIRAYFLKRVRDEIKFPGIKELSEQLRKDISDIKEILFQYKH